ncbi:hypothetical protein J1N35_022357 [Gossypium stocksii]|uniref:Uncharacterized protein n=1 Tax=Gossypium stocksii TaxID=47602 RepID=A0A9D4A125_9ROSI|nr:hypothetical protein J1N35_022357 [Gossypium stocksii]
MVILAVANRGVGSTQMLEDIGALGQGVGGSGRIRQLMEEKSMMIVERELIGWGLKEACNEEEANFGEVSSATKKNLENYLSKLKANNLLHVQVAVKPLDVWCVDFDSLCNLTNIDLRFDVFSPSNKKWEEILKE